MKKHSLLKILAIVIGVLVVLSWIIPGSQVAGAEVAKTDIARVGLFHILNYPLLAFQFFIQMILFILVIGGFYGILNKTGRYTELVDKIAKLLKGKEIPFLVITAFIFAAFSSVFGFSIVIFIFVPFIVSIILLLGYDKLVAFLITIASIFIGMIGATYSYQVTYYINQLLSLGYNDQIITKIALFILTFVIYIIFTIKYANKVKKSSKNSVLGEKTPDVFLGTKTKGKTKKKVWPIALILSLLFILFFMGSVPWSETFEISVFKDFNEWLLALDIKGHTIIAYILGEIGELGTWYYTELTMILVISSIILSIIYKIKVDEAIDAFAEGAKKLLKPVIVMTFAMVILIIVTYHPFFSTIAGAMIDWASKFNILSALITSVIAIIGSALNIEMVYLAQSILPLFATLFESAKPIVAVIFQAMYGLTMFVAPTSLMLILGLEYLEIPYKTWLKFSWKLLLQLLAVILAVIIIITLV